MHVVGENYCEVTATHLKHRRRNRLIVHDNGVGVFKWVFYWFYYMENASS